MKSIDDQNRQYIFDLLEEKINELKKKDNILNSHLECLKILSLSNKQLRNLLESRERVIMNQDDRLYHFECEEADAPIKYFLEELNQ